MSQPTSIGSKKLARRGGCRPWTMASRVALLYATAHAGACYAQAASQSGGQNQDVPAEASSSDIVVTAQKRSERLLDIPMSISVLGGQQLDRATGKGVADVLATVPGVAITPNTTSASPLISIRGVVGAGTFSGSSPVGYYLDSVPFAFVRTPIVPDAGTFDLERIEALRGPQGTLYGASAENGVVRILTKDANLDRFELKGRSSVSGTQYGGANYGVDAAVNVPLVNGKLAMRAVGGYNSFSGWIDRTGKDDANNSHSYYLRYKVNAQPTERLSVGASVWLSRADSNAPDVGNADRFRAALADEPTKIDYEIYAFKAAYQFDTFTVNSATSYIDYRLQSFRDTAILGRPDNYLITHLNAQTFSQEVNLASTAKGPWQWTLGGIYRDGKDELYQIRENYALTQVLAPYVAPADMFFTSHSYAAFGQLTRKLFDDRVELTAGLRYFHDKVSVNEASRLNAAPSSQLIERGNSYNAVTPRAALTWHPSAHLTTYASYSEGFRSGADQLPTVIVAAPTIAAVKPDRLKNYEVGAKGSALNGALTFEAALYYIKWLNVQQPLSVQISSNPATFQSAIVNGASASGVGYEISTTIRPVRRLSLDLNFSQNNLTQDANVISGPTLLFLKGERLNFSPKYTTGASLTYSYPLSGSLDAKFSIMGTYTSKQKQQVLSGTTIIRDFGDSMLNMGGRLSVASQNGWTASLFVDNLTNAQGAVYRDSSFPNGYNDNRIRPRTIGLQVEFKR